MMVKNEMINKENFLVATVHNSREMNSNYIKFTIENNIEQLANFMLNVLDCESVRIFDNSQDSIIFERVGNKFIFEEPEYQIIVSDIVKEMELIKEGKKAYKPVKIYNYWMEDKYNNLEQIIQIIHKYNLKVNYSLFIDAVK